MGTLGMPWTTWNLTPTEKVCADPNCGEEFIALHPIVKYCTSRCRERHKARVFYYEHKKEIMDRRRAKSSGQPSTR